MAGRVLAEVAGAAVKESVVGVGEEDRGGDRKNGGAGLEPEGGLVQAVRMGRWPDSSARGNADRGSQRLSPGRVGGGAKGVGSVVKRFRSVAVCNVGR